MTVRMVRVPCQPNRLSHVIKAAENFGAQIIESWADIMCASLQVDVTDVKQDERSAYIEALTRICERAAKI